MKRREFLKLTLASSLLAGCESWLDRGEIGLALGGGGARGLAHIPMLELLDEMGVRPHRIAGTSIGAVIGALYASGMSGKEIRRLADGLTVSSSESWLDSLLDEDVGRWLEFFDLRPGRGGLIDTDAFGRYLEKTIGVTEFDQLGIPLKIVATDFYRREQVVFDHGRLRPAVQASIAIPGLFNPLSYRGRVLVDGGLVNPVPWDLLFDECDFVIAIDVGGERVPRPGEDPGYFEILFNTMQIMQASLVNDKLNTRPPQVYIRPKLEDIQVLDFNRVDEIYAQAMPARQQLRRELLR